MTTSQTIDGVPRELLERLLTDACNENWSDLNALLHSPPACRCKRYGKGNPHWPCPVHASPPAQHQVEPTEEMKEAGCQAYMDADGMIGIMHRSSMGHAYRAMRALEQPAPVADPLAKGFTTLESDGGKYKIVTSFATRDDAWSAYRALVGAKPAPVAVVLPEREMYCQYLRGVIPDNRLEVEAHKDGWNACLEELKRLNPSL